MLSNICVDVAHIHTIWLLDICLFELLAHALLLRSLFALPAAFQVLLAFNEREVYTARELEEHTRLGERKRGESV